MRRIRHGTFRYLICIAAALLLQGCSAIRLGYNHADDLARWWLDQYLDLSSAQDALARERLKRLHAWHRKTQLPEYVVLARQAQKLISSQTSTGDVLALLEDINRSGVSFAERAAPGIADFLPTLAPQQIERMSAQLAEKTAAYAKEIQLADGDGGQRKAQFRRVLERSEYWFGDFSEEQQLALRRLIDLQPIAASFWYEERMRRQREWLELVRSVQRDRLQRERIIPLFMEYAVRFESPGNPVRLAQAQAARRHAAELLVAILGMATPTQRIHAQHKLDDLIADFTALTQEE